jgi:hypothetical protein
MRRFVIIGAQRAGTSYLARALDEHPEICMAQPIRPEPKFFLREGDCSRGLEWYDRTYFSGCGDSPVRGEKSVGYLDSDVAAARMEQLIPDARLIAILRDPVERAISNYRFSVDNGLEHLPIDEALTVGEDERVTRREGRYWVGGRSVASHPFAYRTRGLYAQALDRYGYWAASGRLLVLLFERAVGSARALADVFAFLEVETDFAPTVTDTVVNPSRAWQHRPSEEVMHQLIDFFTQPNQVLSSAFGLDLSVWSSS